MQDIKSIIEHTSKLTLLFVEDNLEARDSALSLFEEFFDDIIVGVDGRDGLEKFTKNHVDLIITDIYMPHLNGLKMIQQIRKRDKDIPIVVLSAHMEAEHFLESIKLNVQGYLIKPIDMNGLLDLFRKIISSLLLEAEIAKNQKIKDSDHKYLQTIVDSIQDPIMVIRENYTIELMNSQLESQLDRLSIQDRNNPKCYEVSHSRSTPCDGLQHPCPLKSVLESGCPTTVVHEHLTVDGTKNYIELAASPLLDDEGNCIGIIESGRDITTHVELVEELHQKKNRLRHQAYHDGLTDLANRILFNIKLKEALQQAKKNRTKVALFFMDLDNFKKINDTLGHRAGDFALITASHLMRKELRDGDTAARIGGDEFIIIMNNLTAINDAKLLAQRLLHAMKKPISFEEHELQMSASIGISIYPDDTSDDEELLRYADTAMYRAKNGKEKVVYYSDQSER